MGGSLCGRGFGGLEFGLPLFLCIFLCARVVLHCKHRRESTLPWSRWARWLFFPLQAGEKNELFSSKHAYSWPIVSFDLGMGRLHEWALLSCYVYTVCELLKVVRALVSSGRDYSAGMLVWWAGTADLPDAVYLFVGHMTVGMALTKK